jgi:undecaprenyl-phosphate 4-deoxy-4-formamido-L-arabinose transferase
MAVSKKKLSFVIPCYGSEKTIQIVINEITDIVNQNKKYDYEIICVNDQSPDNVLNILVDISKNNKKVKVINLAKNMNRPGAVMAGLSNVSGDYVIVMDDDGQCPMENLWDLIKPLEDGHDVSMAKYTEYKQSIFKSFGTIVNRKMTEVIMGKPKDLNFTNFMAMQRYIVNEILRYKNPYPYMTGLLLRTTSDFVNVKMEERKRISGNTTFTFKKMLNLWINGFTAFSVKPLRISTIIGALTALIGFIFGIFIIIRKIIIPESILAGYSSLMAIILFVGGIIMMMLGMIGEYIGRIYICINNSPQFVIKQTFNMKEEEDERE